MAVLEPFWLLEPFWCGGDSTRGVVGEAKVRAFGKEEARPPEGGEERDCLRAGAVGTLRTG